MMITRQCRTVPFSTLPPSSGFFFIVQPSTDGFLHLQTAITAVRVTAFSVVGWVRLFSAQKDKTTLIINDAMLLKNTISISRMSLEFHYAERVDRTGSIIIIFFVICKRLYASQWAHDVRLTLDIGWILVGTSATWIQRHTDVVIATYLYVRLETLL